MSLQESRENSELCAGKQLRIWENSLDYHNKMKLHAVLSEYSHLRSSPRVHCQQDLYSDLKLHLCNISGASMVGNRKRKKLNKAASASRWKRKRRVVERSLESEQSEEKQRSLDPAADSARCVEPQTILQR